MNDLMDIKNIERRAPAYELAFVEGGRALDLQERRVEGLQSRAGVLVAGAAVTTTFFGSRASGTAHLQAAAWAAILAFALVGATVLIILWPRHDWEFAADTGDLVTYYAETRELPLVLIHRELALHRAQSHAANARLLLRLSYTLRAGLILLVFEIAAWVVALVEGS